MMTSKPGILTKLLLLPLVLILAAIAASGLFLTAGYLLSLMLPLSLFQATMLAIGSSFVLVVDLFIIGAVFVESESYSKVKEQQVEGSVDERDQDEYEDEYEDVEENFATNDKRPIVFISSPPDSKSRTKVGRNAPCPCGSGRKYKYCCGQ